MSLIIRFLTYLKITFMFHVPFNYLHHCQILISAIQITYSSQIVASIKKKQRPLSSRELLNGCRLGIDSHADISCLGRHARITQYHDGINCSVQPFNDGYKPITNVSIADGAFAADSPDGTSAILHINHALDFTSSMEHLILCTNQARANGTIVNDVPAILDNKSPQNMVFPQNGTSFPIAFNGPVPFINVRYPTDDDMDSMPHIHVTSEDRWNPEILSTTRTSVSGVEHQISENDSYWMSNILSDNVNISGVNHVNSKALSPEYLSTLWSIPIHVAKRTLDATTQDNIRFKDGSGNVLRRVKTRPHQSRYRQLGGHNANFASDTFQANIESLRGNKYAQLFCNRANYVKIYPQKAKSDAHHSLNRFIHEVGIPVEMITDGALELSKSEWGKICMKRNIYQVTTEPHSPWQNPAENMGGRLKHKAKTLMRKTNTPARLWDYCWEFVASLISLTASDHPRLDGNTPYATVHGSTPNITEYLYFKWYQWVWYNDPSNPETQLLGRWLGPAHDCGQGLAHHVLSMKGRVKTRSTVTALSDDEKNSDDIQQRMKDFTENINTTIGNYSASTAKKFSAYDASNDKGDIYDQIFDDDDNNNGDIEHQELNDDGTPFYRPEIDEYDKNDPPFKESTDENIGRRVCLPHHSGEMHEAIVKKRKLTTDGALIGTKHSNPLLDTREYQVEFPDGTTAEYASNVIAENLYSQIDEEGNTYTSLSGISNHKSDSSAITRKMDGTQDQVAPRRESLQPKDGGCKWIGKMAPPHGHLSVKLKKLIQ